MRLVTGRVLPIPRERHGVVVDQYASTTGPVFQSTGNGKYLHQVTKEVQLLVTSKLNIVFGLVLYGLPALGALGTNKRNEPLMYLWAVLFTQVIVFPVILLSTFLMIVIAAALWGQPPAVLEDVGASNAPPAEVVGAERPEVHEEEV